MIFSSQIRKPYIALGLFGFLHLLVDAVCAALIAGMQIPLSNKLFLLTSLILLYNVLAFATQLPFGLLADHLKKAKAISIAGAFVTCTAPFFALASFPAAIVAAGIGNALFHVGGGAVAYASMPGRASGLGAFVAPGAAGLFIGGMVGVNHGQIALAVLLAIFAAAAGLLTAPEKHCATMPLQARVPGAALICLLLVFSIFVRSIAGLGAGAFWKGNLTVVALLVAAAFFGKLMGGFIADRYGWLKTCAPALLIASPLMALGSSMPVAAIAGVFLVQITMGATFGALCAIFPGKPSTAFGIGCMALLAGALPVFSSAKFVLQNPYAIAGMIMLSGLALIYAFSKLPAGAHDKDKISAPADFIHITPTLSGETYA